MSVSTEAATASTSAFPNTDASDTGTVTTSSGTGSGTPSATVTLATAGSTAEPLATAVPIDPVVADPVSVPHGNGNGNGETAIEKGGSKHNKWCIGLAVVVVLVLAIALGVWVGRSRPSASGGAIDGSGASTQVPAPSLEELSPEEERREAMIELLAGLYPEHGADVFLKEDGVIDGAEHRKAALEWMLEGGLAVPDPDDGLDEMSSNSTIDDIEDNYEARVFKVLERYVLAVMYYAMDGENWEDDFGFLDHSTDVCTWNDPSTNKGVQCDDGGRPRELLMYWNGLGGTLPPELGFFSDDMVGLNLGGGHITGTIPTELANLANLETLNLHDNCFEGTFPSEILELPKIGIFVVNNNANLAGFNTPGEDEYAPTILSKSFCDGDVRREGVVALIVDCPPWWSNMDDVDEFGNTTSAPQPSPWGCDCCVCCDPTNFDCEDLQTGGTWKALYMLINPPTGIPRSFESQCLAASTLEWIDTECPCLQPGPNTFLNDELYCTTNCDGDEAVPTKVAIQSSQP